MAKKQKRMSRKELRKPDEVEVALKGFWKAIEDHWKLLVGGAAALIVIGGVMSAVSASVESSRQETALAFSAALAPLTADLGDPPPGVEPTADDRERYADRATAVSEAITRLDAFLQAHGDSDTAGAAELARAAAKLDAGALEAWLGAHADSPMAASVMVQVGDAHAKAGAPDKAREWYRKAADASDGFGKAIALMAIGDLDHPLAEGGGDAAAARKAYEEAQAVVGPRPARNPLDIYASFTEPYVYAELENKLALLP